MRRSELVLDDDKEIAQLLEEIDIGNLGVITDESIPRIVPLNFVWFEGAICFHGADEGEKFELLMRRPRVSFLVKKVYSQIPSYWLAKDYACPATQFYKSVYIKGRAEGVTDLHQKATILEAMMKKYQPEGGYKPINPDDKMYLRPLKEVAVFKIITESTEMKNQFGQKNSLRLRRSLVEKLEERNGPRDTESAEEIRRTLP